MQYVVVAIRFTRLVKRNRIANVVSSDKSAPAVSVKKPRFYYGYVVVAAAFVIMVVAAGTAYSFGVFFKPMAEDFGWSRTATSGPYSLLLFTVGSLSLLTGTLTDRFGSRLVATICGVILGLGFLLMSRISAMWQLYLTFGLMVGIGQSGGLVPLLSTVAHWFSRRRALMTGIMAAGASTGQAVIPPVATRLIASEGWRDTVFTLGLVVLIVMVVAAQFLRRAPSPAEKLASGGPDPRQETTKVELEGLSRNEALRTGQLWMLCAIYFCYDFVLQTVMVHAVPHATDLGISAVAAANILAIIGIMGSVGRIANGSAADRIGNKRAIIIAFIMLLLGFILLEFAQGLWTFYLSALIFGFGYGGLVVMYSPTVAELFGLKAHGAIVGMIFFSITLGGASGPLVVGRIFDVTGSYQMAFIAVTIVGAIGLSLATLIRQPRYKWHKSQTGKI